MNYEVLAHYDSYSHNIIAQEIEKLYWPLETCAEFASISYQQEKMGT